MKKLKENESTNFNDLDDIKIYEDVEYENINLDKLDINEGAFKEFKEDEEKDEYINTSMKKFRLFIGVLCLVTLFMSGSLPNTDYRNNLASGTIEGVNAGDILSKDSLKLEAKDALLEITKGFGNIEISIWNFSEVEDNDYVQVFIDGVAQGAPFSIRHKPVKISVPDKAVIQVQGVRDGSNNGITYAVFFNKTGETYLNTVPLNMMNTYTIISK
ncbi:hypothetical protein EAI30_01925 [Romboutsia ilealis]|uniref:Uncharacterized protein n=1 Tax=Romboutsia faecis TaxID=2764597 RepID=A0ABR7JMT7_9FIRM|nr:hypothetical protein [Romboutsia faecis]MBC5996170.1 hypothetical protein [Romboutsia faecis]MRN23370.1 hypothetical protein [Romboutsia ilealis]